MKFTRYFTLALAVGLPTASAAAVADERYYGNHMMWGGGWFFGPVMMLAFLALVVFLVVLLVRWLWPAGPSIESRGTSKSAIAILEERFARGEIDKEEFEEKKRLIGK